MCGCVLKFDQECIEFHDIPQDVEIAYYSRVLLASILFTYSSVHNAVDIRLYNESPLLGESSMYVWNIGTSEEAGHIAFPRRGR